MIIYPVNTTFPSPRANTIQILQTANALAAAGHTVHLLAKRGQTTEAGIFDYYGLSPHPALTLHLIPEPKLIKSAKGHESLVLKRTLQVLTHFRNQQKVVFTRDPLFASLLIKMRRLLRFRVVYEAHTLFFITAKETYMAVAWNEGKENRIRKRERFILEHSDGVVFISKSLQDFASQQAPTPKRSVVVHDGTVIPERLPAEKQSDLICYSGQLYPWKGISILLEAMRWVETGRLYIYGGGYSTAHDDLREIDKLCNEYSLSNRVEVRGFVPPRDVAKVIGTCAIGVLPLPKSIVANHCNSPLKLFDYMANGLAVVSSDLLTIREIVEHGKNGHLVAPGDGRALADGINQLLTQHSYRQSLAANAFESVRAYSWNERGLQISRFLSETLAS